MKNYLQISLLLIIAPFISWSQTVTEIEGNTKIEGQLKLFAQEGDSSIYIGANTGGNAQSFGKNIFVGNNSGQMIRNSFENVVIGNDAGIDMALSGGNVFIGYKSGKINGGGFNNVYVGREAGKRTNRGFNNVYVGNQVASDRQSGTHNTYVGSESAGTTEGNGNTFIGYRTNHDFTRLYGVDSSIAIGIEAIVGCDKCAVIGGVGANAVKLGVGTSIPTHTFTLAHSTENPVTGAGLQIANIDANQNSWELYTANSGGALIFLENGNIVRSLKEDGTFMLGSDRRLKSNIQPIEGETMEKILALRPTSYTYNHQKQSTKRSLGFVAQELQKVFPEMVDVINSDAPLDEQRLGVAYESLIPILVKGMQEQQKMIAELQKEIKKMKNE